MDIPDTCKSWREKLESGNDGDKRTLDNICSEKCLASDITDDFFEHLAAEGNPHTPNDARNAATSVVGSHKDSFLCQGNEIPADSFNTLFRLESVSSLKRLFPSIGLGSYGIRDNKILNRQELPDDELEDVLQELIDNVGELALGNKLDIVWVTDNDEVEQISIKTLIDKLGMSMKEGERCLKVVFKRDKTKKNLHLPRSFDGINYGQFKLVENCQADAGKTLPLNPPYDEGLPEAVHRGCKVKPEIFEVGII